MSTNHSIRAVDAPQIYRAVIDNFRRAYAENHNGTADALSDQEVLECWEVGWAAPTGEEEDAWTLEAMRERLLDKP